MEILEDVLGLGADDLAWWQMLVRAIVVYVAVLAMVRIGEKRFLGKSTPFDVILGIILGSVASQAITGSAPLFPVLVAGATLVTMHWLFAAIAFRVEPFDNLIKGRARVLVDSGDIQWDKMRSTNITRQDLMGELRMQMKTEGLEQVQIARLERSGGISMIPTSEPPKVFEVRVEAGVQIVRIQLE